MTLEDKFTERLLNTITECKKLGYYPSEFEHMIGLYGGKETAIRLVQNGHIQSGLKKLISLGRSELSVESIMQEDEFSTLFRNNLLEAAKWRLKAAEDDKNN